MIFIHKTFNSFSTIDKLGTFPNLLYQQLIGKHVLNSIEN